MIYSIHLDLCEFNEETLKLFFTTIYKSKCFNYLNEIYIRNINEPKTLETLILQLLNTDTIPFGKIIKTLDICSSGFSANHILSTMTQNKTGLKQLKIRNCRFYEPIKTTQLQSLKGIDTLDLSGCNFTVNSLISLFKSLTNVTEYPKALIMDGIQLEGDNFIDFYSQIISIQLPTIETISWRSNIINDKNSSEFFVFLKNQPKLVDIDLSYCISNKEISTINNLKNFLKEKPIKRFVVKGNDNYYIEGQLLPILTQFINSNDIKCIDVCGQQFGDEGLSILNTLMHKSLMAIAFDGSNGSLDSIMKLLENVSKSNNIKCLLWPENDLKKALEQSPMQVIDKMKLKLEKLENIIRKKCLDVDNINAFCDLITVKRLKNSIGDDDENVKDINYIGNIVQIQNKELIELINETIGNKCDLAENDPIMMKITKMIKQ